MAPEQITSQMVSTQTDVFSMGVIMYEVATGRRPFLAASAGEIANKIVNEQPPSPKAVNPKIDGMRRPDIIAAFTQLGFAGWLH